MTDRWLAVAADQLCWAHWRDEYVLYHRPSGKTHFVNAATALLLQQLLYPLSAAQAAQALADAQSALADEAFRSGVVDLLHRLEDLGLVTRQSA